MLNSDTPMDSGIHRIRFVTNLVTNYHEIGFRLIQEQNLVPNLGTKCDRSIKLLKHVLRIPIPLACKVLLF